jgi:hypothetical protein
LELKRHTLLTDFIEKKKDNKINVVTLTERNTRDADGLYPSAKKLKYALKTIFSLTNLNSF